MPLTHSDGIHPAHAAIFNRRSGFPLHTAAAPAPVDALDVDLIARMRVDAFPHARLNLHPLHEDPVVFQQYLQGNIGVELRRMLNIGCNRPVALQGYTDQMDGPITGASQLLFLAGGYYEHPANGVQSH